MFDYSYNKTESKVVAVTKEIEKTISPDKVTEMYDAVREQAENDILRSYKIESNTLNGVVIEMRDSIDTLQRKVVGKYSLNGNEYIMKEFVRPDMVKNEQDLVKMLFDHYERDVASKLVKQTLSIKLANSSPK